MAPKNNKGGEKGGKGKDASAAAGSSKKGDKGDKGASGGDAGGKVKASQFINVRHILCEKHGKKEEALTKLKEGASFDAVAKEFSEDKARVGGALGWKKRGDLDLAFEEKAFELETSTMASPKWVEVKTGFGYHIIMVEGRK